MTRPYETDLRDRTLGMIAGAVAGVTITSDPTGVIKRLATTLTLDLRADPIEASPSYILRMSELMALAAGAAEKLANALRAEQASLAALAAATLSGASLGIDTATDEALAAALADLDQEGPQTP